MLQSCSKGALKGSWKLICVSAAPFFHQIGAYFEGNQRKSYSLLLAVFTIFAALQKIRKSQKFEKPQKSQNVLRLDALITCLVCRLETEKKSKESFGLHFV